VSAFVCSTPNNSDSPIMRMMRQRMNRAIEEEEAKAVAQGHCVINATGITINSSDSPY